MCVCLCGWFDVDDGAVSGKDCCPRGLCHLLLDGLAKKKKIIGRRSEHTWKNLSNCLFSPRIVNVFITSVDS